MDVINSHQPEKIKKIMFQIFKGLEYMNSQKIIHRDIKPQNLLLNSNLTLKICDFGFARILSKQTQQLTDYVATRWYRAPQLLIGSNNYDSSIDIWSAGCIMAQLIDGNPLFPGDNQIDQLYLIRKCIGPLTTQQEQQFIKDERYVGFSIPQIYSVDSLQKKFKSKIDRNALDLLTSILRNDPKQRISVSRILSHPYFNRFYRPNIEVLRNEFMKYRNEHRNYQNGKQRNRKIESRLNECEYKQQFQLAKDSQSIMTHDINRITLKKSKQKDNQFSGINKVISLKKKKQDPIFKNKISFYQKINKRDNKETMPFQLKKKIPEEKQFDEQQHQQSFFIKGGKSREINRNKLVVFDNRNWEQQQQEGEQFILNSPKKSRLFKVSKSKYRYEQNEQHKASFRDDQKFNIIFNNNVYNYNINQIKK